MFLAGAHGVMYWENGEVDDVTFVRRPSYLTAATGVEPKVPTGEFMLDTFTKVPRVALSQLTPRNQRR